MQELYLVFISLDQTKQTTPESATDFAASTLLKVHQNKVSHKLCTTM